MVSSNLLVGTIFIYIWNLQKLHKKHVSHTLSYVYQVSHLFLMHNAPYFAYYHITVTLYNRRQYEDYK